MVTITQNQARFHIFQMKHFSHEIYHWLQENHELSSDTKSFKSFQKVEKFDSMESYWAPFKGLVTYFVNHV